MAFLEIPIDTSQSDHEFSMELERVVYIFRFKFNFRAGRWTMDIKKEDGSLVISGVPLVVSYPLTDRFGNQDLPPGTLFVMDLNNTNAEPGELSFGTTHRLIYRESTT